MNESRRHALRETERCEVCANDRLTPVLDLGSHPLCDDLVPVRDDRICREYPIEILLCEKCATAQQRFQIPKRDLFPPSYHYRARFTADVLRGMAGLVESCVQHFGALEGRSVLDIGCNDGSLLDCFREKGARTLGVEPTEAAPEARHKGHAIFQDYLSADLANKIVTTYGRPDFITFTNVFAHIENLGEVIESLRILLAEGTVIVIENHYLGSVLEGGQFDTFYHEHARTYGYTSFLKIAEALDVRLLRVEFPARYGGNIRVFLGSDEIGRDNEESHDDLLRRETLFVEDFARLRSDLESWRGTKVPLLQEYVRQFGKLPAKAFPARAAILIKLLGLSEESLSAIYEKPGSLKIGHYVPGTRIPIRSDDELFALPDQTRPLVNLAWHIPREIREYLTAHGYAGQIIDILSPEDLRAGRPT